MILLEETVMEVASMPRGSESERVDKEEVDRLAAKLSKYQAVIAQSKLFKETIESIGTAKSNSGKTIAGIRCLALGSPSNSSAALYQLAFLIELSVHLEIGADKVTLYDPVFTKLDEYLIIDIKRYSIEKEGSFDSASTLFFLPHASLELTESLLKNDRPNYLLGNDLISHTDRLTKRRLFDSFNLIALLVKLLDEKNSNGNGDAGHEDGFTTVVGKKRKNRKNKQVFMEPQISYDFGTCYFKDTLVARFKETEGVWGNAFSDLALHVISSKDKEGGFEKVYERTTNGHT